MKDYTQKKNFLSHWEQNRTYNSYAFQIIHKEHGIESSNLKPFLRQTFH